MQTLFTQGRRQVVTQQLAPALCFDCWRPKPHDDPIALATLSNTVGYADSMQVPSIWLSRSAQPVRLIRSTCLSRSHNDAQFYKFPLADNTRLDFHTWKVGDGVSRCSVQLPSSFDVLLPVQYLPPWDARGSVCRASHTYTHVSLHGDGVALNDLVGAISAPTGHPYHLLITPSVRYAAKRLGSFYYARSWVLRKHLWPIAVVAIAGHIRLSEQ